MTADERKRLIHLQTIITTAQRWANGVETYHADQASSCLDDGLEVIRGMLAEGHHGD